MLANPLFYIILFFKKTMDLEFLKIFENVRDISLEKIVEITQNLEKKKFKKNEVILSAGMQETNLYFITKGLVRMYIVDKKGEEKSYRFFLKNKFFTILPSFVDEIPSLYFTQAIEETEVIVIPKQQLLIFYEKFPFIEKVVREQTERYLIEMSNHLYNLHMHSSTERYRNFVKENKELAKVLPIKYISTFLGIHPNSLSRIRKTIGINNL